MADRFDFIVIGAGMAGASVAAELSRTHAVVVLEQEERPGYHATGRSAALYTELYGNAVIRALTRASRAFYLAEPAEGPRFARPRGCLYIASNPQIERLDAFAGQADVQAATKTVSAEEARRRVPVLRTDYIAGAVSEAGAFDLDVDAIHQFFLRGLRAGGGVVLCGHRLTEAAREGGKWRVVAGTRCFEAPVLIDAAGAWGDTVAALAGVRPVGLQPKRRTAALVDPPRGAAIADWPAVIDIDEQFYFKPDAARIFLSPADETDTEACDAWPEDLDVALAIERVQAAADIPVTRAPTSWAGLRTFAPDRTPVVGYDQAAQGFFWLVGQGGYGIQTAPALSRVAAALALGEPIPADILGCGLEAGQLDPARPFAPAEPGPQSHRP